jgi:hypothetical protein
MSALALAHGHETFGLAKMAIGLIDALANLGRRRIEAGEAGKRRVEFGGETLAIVLGGGKFGIDIGAGALTVTLTEGRAFQLVERLGQPAQGRLQGSLTIHGVQSMNFR